MCAGSGWPCVPEVALSPPHLHSISMGQKSLSASQSLYIAGKPRETSPADRLHADAFDEVSRAEPAAPASPASGGQDVVAAASVIAQRLRCPRSHKDGT